MDLSGHLTIGGVTAETKLTARACRFYEARGLVNPVRLGALRYYSPANIERLREIQKLTRYGFTLSEIKKGISARDLIKQHGELVMRIEDMAKAAVEIQDEIKAAAALAELNRRG